MGKDKNRKDRKSIPSLAKGGGAPQGISKIGKKVIAAGIGLLVLGFYVLSLTDPEGQNWASHLSPFMILGAYAIIAVGIILPDRPKDEPLADPIQNNS